jgi:hypothetical protein
MKAYFQLLYYLLTWQRFLLWLVRLGLVLFAGVVVLALLGEGHTGFGLAIYAFVPLLALPYVVVWYPFRQMLASRRLALVPGFHARMGVVLLQLTFLVGAYLPLASQWLWPGAIPLPVALVLFIAASLFTFLMQWVITTPFTVWVLSFGPVFIVYLALRFRTGLGLLFAYQETRIVLFCAATLLWGLALRTLVTRRGFSPPRPAAMSVRDYAWDGRADWIGILLGNYRGPVQSAAGTLLLGYPDGVMSRFFYLLNMVLISPLAGVLVLYVTASKTEFRLVATLPGLFVMFSIFTCIVTGFGTGELAARSRLVWIRQSGGRLAQWRRIERQLFADFSLLTLIILSISGAAMILFDTITFDPFRYCLMALGGNILGSYFSLAARISQWSLLLQILSSSAMLAGLGLGQATGFLTLPVLFLLTLGLVMLFRQQARQRFVTIDWFRLRPACLSLTGKT